MNRDKLIRRATSHIKNDEARINAINYLCRHPHLLKQWKVKMRKDMVETEQRRPKRGKGLVNYSLWLTADEYLKLKSKAAALGISMAAFIRTNL